MAEIVLSTLNAKYIHAAFGLRYLLANLGELQSRAVIAEFDIQRRPLDIAERLLELNPKIIGLGVYIWNVAEITALVGLLKKIRPEIVIVLGGPEVSYEQEEMAVVQLADYVITGEGDLLFAEVCGKILRDDKPTTKILAAPLPDLALIKLPYTFYTEADLDHRIVYVEASRGCPFACEFCLSSLDIAVRQFPLDAFLAAMQGLLDRGLKHFKFVDRTFNLEIKTGKKILEFCLERYQPGIFFHFELVPDRLPTELREVIAKFPSGAIQFEVGVQTFNAVAAANIQRRQNYDRLAENFSWLRENSGVHLHADLIAGLPGEDLESFAAGFDRLLALRPQEIQVGILKRLRGTPIGRHSEEWQMVYNPNPPYDILQNKLIPFATMQEIRRFTRFWDMVSNSGNFRHCAPLLWEGEPSAFAAFMAFANWLFARVGRTDGIALPRLTELLFEFLTQLRRLPAEQVAAQLLRDYQAPGRRDTPSFLQPYLPGGGTGISHADATRSPMRRQARHLGG